jgi:hypothetical protein
MSGRRRVALANGNQSAAKTCCALGRAVALLLMAVGVASALAPHGARRTIGRSSSWRTFTTTKSWQWQGPVNQHYVVGHAAAATALRQAHSDWPQRQLVHIMSWDGCLFDATQYHVQTGHGTACLLWPEIMQELQLQVLGPATISPEYDVTTAPSAQWLMRKLMAMRAVLTPGNVSVTGQYAVALRLLLAEQSLLLQEQGTDQAVTKTARGKYASRFHPAQHRNQKSTRPLTVGELVANWPDLLEISLVRYRLPAPLLSTATTQAIQSWFKQHGGTMIRPDSRVVAALQQWQRQTRTSQQEPIPDWVVVTVSQQAELELVTLLLQNAQLNPVVLSMDSDNGSFGNWKRGSVLVLCCEHCSVESFLERISTVNQLNAADGAASVSVRPVGKDVSKLGGTPTFLADAPATAEASTRACTEVYYMDSSLKRLQQLQPLLGDDVPLGRTSLIASSKEGNVNLALIWNTFAWAQSPGMSPRDAGLNLFHASDQANLPVVDENSLWAGTLARDRHLDVSLEAMDRKALMDPWIQVWTRNDWESRLTRNEDCHGPEHGPFT